MRRITESTEDPFGTSTYQAALHQVTRNRTWSLACTLWATDAAHVAALLGDTRPNMAFTDPPYNVSMGNHGGRRPGHRRRRLTNDSLPPAEWEAFVRAWASTLLVHVNGALYVCMSSKDLPLVSPVLAEEGAHWSDTLVLENSIARSRALAYLVQTALKALEVGELENRISLLERAVQRGPNDLPSVLDSVENSDRYSTTGAPG